MNQAVKMENLLLYGFICSVVLIVPLIVIFSTTTQNYNNAFAVQQKKKNENITSAKIAIGKSSSKAALELMNSMTLGSGSRYVSMIQNLMNTTSNLAKLHVNTTLSSDTRAGNNSMSLTHP